MSRFVNHLKRTDYCGTIRESDIGREVILMGWVQRRRDLGNLIFVDLRDREGIVQIVFNPETNADIHAAAHRIRSEFVIALRGHVQSRPANMVNHALATGSVEVAAVELEILNEAKTTPFQIEAADEVSSNLLLTYRYLDLRRPPLQRNMMLRSHVAYETRTYLHRHGFIEIETPFLTKSTPEGARDYLVPSRINPGCFYSLPQSPQLFKQLLMVSGFDKYYQIVKCFRDEDLRADRQPEFTQIDIEMSFITEDDIIAVMEGLMAHIFRATLNKEIAIPFPRIPYREAMVRFGKDSPDTRYSLELTDITDLVQDCRFNVFQEVIGRNGVVKGITVGDASRISRKDLDGLGQFVSTYGAKGIVWARIQDDGWTSSIAKYLSNDEMKRITERMKASAGSILIFAADTPRIVHDALGNLRIWLAEKLNLIDKEKMNFTWVTEFPMFEYSETEQRLMANHHPFTSPVLEDIPLLQKEPTVVRARAYDLVLNGSEIGGGSIRIHSRDVQSKIFNILGLSDAEARLKFGFLMDALEYGAPPHGGIAFGLDRILMIMTGADSIRDVIAFPKTQKATCLLTGAPSEVSAEQLEELSLKILT